MTAPAASMQQALALSEDMLAASAAGDWAQVQVLDEQLKRCVAQIKMAGPRQRTQLAHLSGNIRSVLTRAAEARHDVKTQLVQHARSHRALKAYVSAPG